LYSINSLKAVALEGAFSSDGCLKAQWSKELLYKKTGREVFAQLLSEGEISSAEFMVLTYPDVKVIGIDEHTLYSVKYPIDDPFQSIFLQYLTKIAEIYSLRFDCSIFECLKI
jgi:hypothetical protein